MEIIKTKAYGEIQVDENSVIYMTREILGFDNRKQYYLIEMGDLPNFYWFQSKEDPDLAFIIVNPRLFMPDYKLTIDEIDMSLLETENPEDLIDFAIVNINDDVTSMTMNLLGPIVINMKSLKAIQAISTNNSYGTKVPVFSHTEGEEKKESEKTNDKKE